MAKKPKTPKFHPKKDADTYKGRSYWLKRLGYGSYAEYLDSDLWKKLRLDVLRKARWRCDCCGEFANQVHHKRYHKSDLLGHTRQFLVPLCGNCHHGIEVNLNTGAKNDVRRANSKLDWFKTPEMREKMARAQRAICELDARFDMLMNSTP